MSFKVLLSGKRFTLGDIELCALLGKEESLNRIKKAMEVLKC